MELRLRDNDPVRVTESSTLRNVIVLKAISLSTFITNVEEVQ